MKVYAFVPAKGTSERIENKNMRFLDGERLYIRALKTLLECKEIDHVFLDTESEEMYRLADYLPIKFMKRDPALATNKTDGHQMFMNEVVTNPDADIYVQMLCTAPFIKPETIDGMIRSLKENPKYDSAILMKKDKFYLWNDNCPEYDINHVPNSEDLPETLIESMGLYVHCKESALRTNRRYGDNPLLVFGELEELIDVNTPEDLEFAEVYASGKRTQENRRLGLLKHFISSTGLSDLLDDMKLERGCSCGAVINGFVCNMQDVKLFGRANTLRLRKMAPDDDFIGIYDALDSYAGIANGEIICVENEADKFAYFGDLNARLAIRAGSVGCIVNGATRDWKNTSLLGFPVFSRGYNAADVRRRAVLDYINKPIKFGDAVINPGDLIFVDECAMVVIYKEFEKDILEKILNTTINESNIIADICNYKSPQDIKNTRGAF